MIYLWDEISGEVSTMDADHAYSEPVEEETLGEIPAMISDDAYYGWRTDHVVDLPDGTRVVIETDERAHIAVWVTTPED